MTQPSTTEDPRDDDALIAAFARGERTAARVLTQRLAPRVLAQAMRMLGSRAEAEDVTQDAMLRLWQAAPTWQSGGAKPSTWLYRVVANLCTDRLRKTGRQVTLSEDHDPADDAPSVPAQIHQADRHSALRRALGALPDRQAQAVALRHLEGLSNPEIAGIMNISAEAVESLTARGKRGLARLLAPHKDELGISDD